MTRSHRIALALLAFVFLQGLGAVQAQTPLGTAFTYQGRLTDSGNPANGEYDVQAMLFTEAVGGTQVGTTVTLENVVVSNGLLTVAPDFGATVFSGGRRFLEIAVRPGASTGAFTPLLPRQELMPAPHARFAVSAATVAGLTCSDGQVLKWSGTTWMCGADADSSSGGTVTSVSSGAGLTGGPITSAGTLSIAAGGVSSAMIAAGAVGSAQIDATQVQARVATACPSGNFLRGIRADGSVMCESFYVGGNDMRVVDDPANLVGSHNSLAITPDGIPLIAYYDETAQALKYALCDDVTCASAAIFTLDDPANAVGTHTSIATADGNVVISYYDVTAGALKVVSCTVWTCQTGFTTIITIDDTNDVGLFTSLAIPADRNPVISYYDQTATALKVARCSDPLCSAGGSSVTVDDAGSDGRFSSLAIGSDGLAVISYYDETNRGLKVAKCVTPNCSGATVITTVDSIPGHFVGENTSIAVGADGLPVISYTDRTNSTRTLKVAKCVNPDCTGTSTITTVGTSSLSRTSLAVAADGLPIIGYYDQGFKTAKCSNAACTGTSQITALDPSVSSLFMRSSVRIGADGLPFITYDDLNNNRLKAVKCRKASCAL